MGGGWRQHPQQATTCKKSRFRCGGGGLAAHQSAHQPHIKTHIFTVFAHQRGPTVKNAAPLGRTSTHINNPRAPCDFFVDYFACLLICKRPLCAHQSAHQSAHQYFHPHIKDLVRTSIRTSIGISAHQSRAICAVTKRWHAAWAHINAHQKAVPT